MKPTIHTIVLTGGPCGGKSTALSKIADRLQSLNYQVFCIPEAATQLIMAGADPRTMNATQMRKFQTAVIQLQASWEKAIRELAENCGTRSVLLLDRGIWDGAAYVPHEQWGTILTENGIATIERDTRYDAVLHLVTAANGAEHAYGNANNPARRESAAEAIVADQRTIDAWTGHPHLRVIGNETSFDEKIQRAVSEITGFLGEPIPIETERKFVVAVEPKILAAQIKQGASSQIVQHYLPCESGELRVRRRGNHGQWAFTRTEKREIPDQHGARIELETRITAEEYWGLLEQYPNAPKVSKVRTCIVHKGTYFELDAIDRKGKEQPLHILEVETTQTGDIQMPDGIWVHQEVTGKKKYSNRSLAH